MDGISWAEYSSTAIDLPALRRFAVKTPHANVTFAFSYVRFSSPAQADGDSIRRQEAHLDAWLKRNPGVVLDSKLVDKGASAYRGKHRTDRKHALARFLDEVAAGNVPVGSVLICENLDRLTRENPIDAIPAVLGLIKAGIRVVQLEPVEVEYNAAMEQHTLMNMLWELGRGHGESKRKSGLCGEAWKAKKEAARTDRTPITKMTPAWLEVANGKYRVKADAARAVRKIFEWCAAGVGTFGILAKLNAENVPPIGRTGAWERSYVRKLLNSVAVLGIYQPGKGRFRTPDGEPVPDFYPRIIDDALWYSAHQAMKNRERRSGRPAGRVANPLSGLLRCALTGSALHIAGSRGHKYLVSQKALMKAKGADWRAFPLEPFLTSVLGELEELKASELFTDPGAGRLAELKTQLMDTDRKLAAATERFEADPESQHWQGLISKYDREKRALVRDMAEERQKAANPASASWAEAVELMRSNEPDRLRAALMATIDSVNVLLLAHQGLKVAAAQVWFKGGERREYVVLHRPQRGPTVGGRPAETEVMQFKKLGLPGSADLRKPEQARKLESLLVKHLSAAKAKAESARARKG